MAAGCRSSHKFGKQLAMQRRKLASGQYSSSRL
jgi:hypothetical protein